MHKHLPFREEGDKLPFLTKEKLFPVTKIRTPYRPSCDEKRSSSGLCRLGDGSDARKCVGWPALWQGSEERWRLLAAVFRVCLAETRTMKDSKQGGASFPNKPPATATYIAHNVIVLEPPIAEG